MPCLRARPVTRSSSLRAYADPNFDHLFNPGAGQMHLQDLARLKSVPCVDDGQDRVRESIDGVENRLIAGPAEHPIVIPVTGANLGEKGLFHNIQMQRQRTSARDAELWNEVGSDCGFSAGRNAIDQDDLPQLEITSRPASPAPITPALSPKRAATTGRLNHVFCGLLRLTARAISTPKPPPIITFVGSTIAIKV